MQKDLTRGNLFGKMMQFAVPYLIACFLQTFYGMADLFITGQFNGAAAVSAVAVGSQVMHMLTVVIVGLAMGTTVCISRSVGAGSKRQVAGFIGNSAVLFTGFAAVLTVVLLLSTGGILKLLAVPEEALLQARQYLIICFIGVPFITVIALLFLLRGKDSLQVTRRDFRPDGQYMGQLLGIGVPVAFQEGLIQVSFLVITAIANSRGVDVAAAVGIVEKIISFLFLVPSSMLSTVSAVTAQNAGAGLHERGKKALRYGITVCVAVGAVVFVICQFAADGIVSLFVVNEPEVVRLGGQYLRSYSVDCAIAGIQFCFSGYFSAYGRSQYSFIHNIISIALVRIPGAYLASVLYPQTLYPMGLAAPMGSLLSSVICLFLYKRLVRDIMNTGEPARI